MSRLASDGAADNLMLSALGTVVGELALNGSAGFGMTVPSRREALVLSQPPSSRYQFHRAGDFWEVIFDSCEPFHVGDMKGLGGIARLLASPREPIPALALFMGPAMTGVRADAREDGLFLADGSGMPCSDQTTVAAAHNRLADLPELIAAATDRGAIEELGELRDEEEWITAYLGAVTDNRGRPRKAGGVTTSARTAVKNRITRATEAIEKHSPEMALHLNRSIRTGAEVVYRPENRLPWEF